MPLASARRATRTALGLPLLAALAALLLAPSALAQTLVINEVLADPPDAAAGDANGDGTRDSAQDEFVEIVNTGTTAFDLSGYTLSDDDAPTARFTFPAGTTLNAGQAAILFGGGTPTGTFGGARVFTDDGTIGSGLGNGGDLVELRNASGALVTSFAYGSAGGATGGSDQSFARNPDRTGAFVDHTTIAGNPVAFSPGVRNADGAAFGGMTGGGMAATIVVNSPLDNVVADALCTLREAVQSANTNTAVGGCTAGTVWPRQRITFAATVTAPIVSHARRAPDHGGPYD